MQGGTEAPSGGAPGRMPEAARGHNLRRRGRLFAAATVATRLARLLQGLRPPGGQHGRQDGPVGWQRLDHPVPGFTTMDGLPVPVVAIRRHSATAQLQVVRGYLTTLESRDRAPDHERHLIPSASFNPHPPRGLTIGDERFQYSTLANSARCRACGRDDLGFGFVSSTGIPVDGYEPVLAPNRSLCETCAERQARVPG